MNLSKLGVLLYGSINYILFLATFLYTIGFVMGFGVPKHIDSASDNPATFTTALLINAGILGLFAVQHTIMARHGFKRRIKKIIPAAAERSTFVLVTCAILISLFYFWAPMPEVVWEVSSPVLRGILHGVSLAGFLGVVAVTFLIDHFELFGIKQAVVNYTGRPFRNPSFQVQSLYRISRHPLYLCFFIAFWSAPTMTVGHLVFAILSTGYVLTDRGARRGVPRVQAQCTRDPADARTHQRRRGSDARRGRAHQGLVRHPLHCPPSGPLQSPRLPSGDGRGPGRGARSR
jgi:protein-S-isoprenylcysteine O-methyltransferase Ste14